MDASQNREIYVAFGIHKVREQGLCRGVTSHHVLVQCQVEGHYYRFVGSGNHNVQQVVLGYMCSVLSLNLLFFNCLNILKIEDVFRCRTG